MMSQAYDEGLAAGRDLARVVADCPYLIGRADTERGEWLKGFSEARVHSSPASNPAHAEHAKEPPNAGMERAMDGHQG